MPDPEGPSWSSSSDSALAACVDHTLLRPDARPMEFERLCAEALEYRFAAVCVPSGRVLRCATALAGSQVRVASVVGFPLGSNATPAKAFEARRACDDGAQELDMVMQIGALKARELGFVGDDIRAVVEACPEAAVKVILETALLDDEEKVLAAQVARAAGAAFVKTCTGFGGGGATVHDVGLLRSAVGDACGVKASGGVRDVATARALLAAGASRIGTSHGVALVAGADASGGY